MRDHFEQLAPRVIVKRLGDQGITRRLESVGRDRGR
jgi:hypothetical protein